MDGILEQLKKKYPEDKPVVLSYNPRQTESLHQVESHYLIPGGIRSFARGIFKGEIFKTLKAIKKSDIFILGGGGLLTDEKLYAVFLWSFHVFVAKLLGKKIWIYANSIGPLNTKIGRFLTRKVGESASFISVRDQLSLDLLQNLKITQKIDLVPDPAFSLSLNSYLLNPVSFSLPNYQLPTTNYFVINLRPWIKHQSKIKTVFPAFIDYLIEKYQIKVILLPFQKLKDNDERLLTQILQEVKNKDHVELKPFNPDYREVLPLIAGAKLVIAMRLHALIFAHLLHTPFLSLTYSSKIAGFLKSINQEKNSLNLEDLTLESLKEKTAEIIN